MKLKSRQLSQYRALVGPVSKGCMCWTDAPSLPAVETMESGEQVYAKTLYEERARQRSLNQGQTQQERRHWVYEYRQAVTKTLTPQSA